MNKEKKIYKDIESILFSYKKYKGLNKNNEYDNLLKKIDISLAMIKESKNYKLIEMRYFKEMTYDEIAEKLHIDIRTVYYNKGRLIEKLRVHFKILGLI